MTHHLPSRRTRVARPRSGVIPEGDGVPVTHTPPTAVPDRKVAPGLSGSAPHTFAASLTIPATVAVAFMVLSVLTLSIIAVLGIYEGHPDRWQIVALFLTALTSWCAALVVPVVIRRFR